MAGRAERGRPADAAGNPPNVLLITLDTVRADHLSLYGYGRSHVPSARKSGQVGYPVRRGRASAPWTLPSHATMFTGRWHHELDANWDDVAGRNARPWPNTWALRAMPRQDSSPTAGMFVRYGLDRGFTHYEDYILEYLLPFRTAWLVDKAVKLLSDAGRLRWAGLSTSAACVPCRNPGCRPTRRWQRKDAGSINLAFMDWLSRRSRAQRPFFAFLNYYDAHAPYVLPAGAGYRFGLKPRGQSDFIFLMEEWETIDKLEMRPVYRELARDSYDNCVAYLDERLGELIRRVTAVAACSIARW